LPFLPDHIAGRKLRLGHLSGNLAYEEGTYSIKIPGSDGKTSEEIGKYIVVWKKGADGHWRLHRDIWNTNPAKK
jgi:ketosteroid isomerase-like protein